MKLSVISFTARGLVLSLAVREALEQDAPDQDAPDQNAPDQEDPEQEMKVTLYTKHKCSSESDNNDDITAMSGRQSVEYVSGTLNSWAGGQFNSQNALLFIGASGIAVRAIAPYVKDKLKDPAVLVMDEAGRFVIPLLSGHYGGANELAKKLAEKLGATAVLTTATDVNGLFAIDVFARRNHLVICNRNGIKAVSSAILSGEKVTIAISGAHQGRLPEELALVSYPASGRASVIVSPFTKDADRADLQLCPGAYSIGIGCRRGKSLTEIEDAIEKQLQEAGIRRESLAALASINLKKEEAGLLQYAKKHHLPFQTFSEEELKRIPGEFTASAFVQEQVGVDNVCERAALAACGEGGRLIIKKQAENGITVAIAERKWSVTF